MVYEDWETFVELVFAAFKEASMLEELLLNERLEVWFVVILAFTAFRAASRLLDPVESVLLEV